MPQLNPAGNSRGYVKFNDPEELDYHFRLFLAGNDRSAAIIWEWLHATMFGYCFYLMQDKTEAKDILCDAFSRLWECKEEIEDLLHARNYIRKSVKWACRKSKAARSKMISLDVLDNPDLAIYDPEDEAEQRRIAAIQMENDLLIEKAIPFLPPSRANIMMLHNRGLKPKWIGEIIRRSYQFVSDEIEYGIEELKIIVPRIKKAEESCMRNSDVLKMNYKIYVSKLQSSILDLYISGMEPNEIARELCMTPWRIAQQIYMAIRKLNRVKDRKNKRKFKR